MNYPVTTGFVWGRIGCRQAEAVFGSGMKVVACTGHEVVADEPAGPYVRQTERWKRCLAVRRGLSGASAANGSALAGAGSGKGGFLRS